MAKKSTTIKPPVDKLDPTGILEHTSQVYLVIMKDPFEKGELAFLCTGLETEGNMLTFLEPFTVEKGVLEALDDADSVSINSTLTQFLLRCFQKDAFIARLKAGKFKEVLGQ